MHDEQIVELYWNRDERAIQETAGKYETYLSKVAYNILGDSEYSKECVNDTYLKAWNSIPPHRPAALSAYLAKITRESAIDIFRKCSSIKRYPSEYALSLSELGDSFSQAGTLDEEIDMKLLQKAINDFLRHLTEDERNAFLGRYYFFDSLKEVAAYLGMSQGKVKSMLFRTRKKLKAYLEKEGFDL